MIDISRLLQAQRPSRYIGAEVNSLRKDWEAASLHFALCFPDAYEIGMSHVGLRILYHVLSSRPDIACERFFAPWPDMEQLLRSSGTPLCSLESARPLKQFEIVGFSLQHELNYTCILQMLDLGGVPLLSHQRGPADPLVIGGGPCAFNPEPLADLFDAFVLGEAEETVIEVADAVLWHRAQPGRSRMALLERLAQIEGVYVPAFFRPRYSGASFCGIEPLRTGCGTVRKRLVSDLDTSAYPEKWIVPFTQIVHDRVAVEIQRGCTRGCRFCQAGMIYRPTRQRSPARALQLATRLLQGSGYEEVSFLSLSAGDYGCLNPMLDRFLALFAATKVAVSLPSLRAETLGTDLAGRIESVRKTGFTLAPEAGSARLRKIINKPTSDQELEAAVEAAFSHGWELLKLYFMIGLPTETTADIEAIAELTARLSRKARAAATSMRGKAQFNITVSTFIPKPHTPFQWEPFVGPEKASFCQRLLRSRLGRSRFALKTSHPGQSLLEAVLSRGDRRLGRTIAEAYRMGCRFDGWTECFDLDRWKAALNAVEGFSGPDEAISYYTGCIPLDRALPWDHLSPLVEKEFLKLEMERSLAGELTPDCLKDVCSNCGACDFKSVQPVAARPDALPGAAAAASPEPANPSRFRVHFTKTGKAGLLSQLETQTACTRSVLRAGLAPVFSQGMHPKQRVSFSPALPVGVESQDEVFDIELLFEGSPAELAAILAAAMPEGMGIRLAEKLAQSDLPLSRAISGAVFRVGMRQPGDSMPSIRQGEEICRRTEGEQNGARILTNGLAPKARAIGIEPAGKGIRLTVRSREGRLPGLKEVLRQVFGERGHQELQIVKERTIMFSGS